MMTGDKYLWKLLKFGRRRNFRLVREPTAEEARKYRLMWAIKFLRERDVREIMGKRIEVDPRGHEGLNPYEMTGFVEREEEPGCSILYRIPIFCLEPWPIAKRRR